MIDTEKIKSQANHEAIVIALGLKNLKFSGKEIRADCPLQLHRKSPQSFSIDRSKGLWICHACENEDAEGDIITLIMKVNNVPFEDAVKFIEEQNGITPATRYQEDALKETTPQEKLLTPQQVLDRSSKNGTHDYLKIKCVDSCDGLYFGKDKVGNNCLIVPLRTVNGQLQTVQFVGAIREGNLNYGKPLFLGGYPSLGAFFTIGTFKNGDIVYIAEGIATALTIWMAYDKKITVISIGSVNNMIKVVDILMNEYPNLKLIICLDASKNAYNQALKINPQYSCSFRIPSFEGLINKSNDIKGLADFNDIISKCGAPMTEVRKQLEIIKSIDDLPIEKKIITQVHEQEQHAPLIQDVTLTSDLELDIIHYILNKSFNQIVDDGFNPDEFELTLFNGTPTRNGKTTISLNRKIVEIIQSHWFSNNDNQAPSITDITLKTEAHGLLVHKLLKSTTPKNIPTAQQIKDRLLKLKDDSTVSNCELILKKLKQGDLITSAGFDLLRNEIEKGKAKSQIIQSDAHYEADIKLAENENKPCIETGFTDLKLLLKGGLKGGKLITLQGKAGSGKSTFMVQLRDYLAKNGTPVVYVTMEQTREELRDISKRRIKLDLRATNNNYSKEQLNEAVDESWIGLMDNIYTIEGARHISLQGSGLHFLTLSQVSGYVRNVIQETGKKPVLFIDPFQRLSIGQKELDSSEYDKINALVALIKYLAINLDITIIMASDVTKDHESNVTGEGGGRGTYMIQHLSDVIITFKESEQDPFEAMYGFIPTESTAGKPREAILTRQQKAIKARLEASAFKKDYSLSGGWDSEKWVALVVSKNRGGKKFSPIFIFEKGVRFKEAPVWITVITQEED